jgi:Pyruvate/2-oxoacid:ferredoxin oxidoreductase delta subunit
LVIGGGDTAMDVAAVARRLGHIGKVREREWPEYVVLGHTAHDVANIANRQGAQVTIVYRRPVDKMPAAKMEIEHVTKEGVEIRSSLAPVEVMVGTDGRATALRVVEVDWASGTMEVKEGSEFNIECDLIVAAIGQVCDFTGMQELDNGKGLISADAFYRVAGRENMFVGGDVIKPHLLTTAIGHASVAAEGIDKFLGGGDPERRPRLDVHHFSLLSKLRETDLAPSEYDHVQQSGTDSAAFAVHNYEDRSKVALAPSDELFLGHFKYEARRLRQERDINSENVLGYFGERIDGLSEEQAREEADRCMSCGMCFECDNCVIYCPQDAVFRVKKDISTMGRYVDTDYTRCIGCHICADVCPSGYIKMGLGE